MSVDTQCAVAEMVAALGYEPFLWDQNWFGTSYKIVQVNPSGLWIIVEGTIITVGARYNSDQWRLTGGVKLDLAKPATTEQKLGEVIKQVLASGEY